jgi:hypothetical protein
MAVRLSNAGSNSELPESVGRENTGIDDYARDKRAVVT